MAVSWAVINTQLSGYPAVLISPVSMVIAGPLRSNANASRPAATDRLAPVAEKALTFPGRWPFTPPAAVVVIFWP